MTAILPATRCKICGALYPARGMASHIRGHGITRDSDDQTIAAAIRAWLRIKEHQEKAGI